MSRSEELDEEILDAIGELSASMIARAEQVARRLGVPAFCLKALHVLSAPMAMRDLGKRLHCDPSFVTAIADLLEEKGLARREPGTADRRIKNLVLTPEGTGLREQVQCEFLACVPWRNFTEEERATLLALIRKMIRFEQGVGGAGQAASGGAGQAASGAAHQAASGGAGQAASGAAHQAASGAAHQAASGAAGPGETASPGRTHVQSTA